MKGLQSLETLLKRKNQRFACIDSGWPEPGPEKFTAHIQHVAELPLSPEELKTLKEQVGAVPQLIAVYERYSSVRLYCDTIGDDSAFFLAHPGEWPDLKNGFKMWCDGLTDSEMEELLPDWLEDCIVVGEIPQSGNYFLIPMSGNDLGKVIEFGHDGFEFIERGSDVSAFLEYISTVDNELIEDILTYTRYSDGKSNIQWLANEYQYEAPAL